MAVNPIAAALLACPLVGEPITPNLIGGVLAEAESRAHVPIELVDRPLSPAREGAHRCAVWLDLSVRIWTIPESGAKNNKAHIVLHSETLAKIEPGQA